MINQQFWSIILSPHRQYKKTPDVDIVVTKATLDTTNATDKHDGLVQVILEHEGRRMTVANLSIKHGIFQVDLDLRFSCGENLLFTTSGVELPVSLTGVCGIDDEDEEMFMDGSMNSTDASFKMDDSTAEGGKKRKLGSASQPPAKAARGADGRPKKQGITLGDQSFMSGSDSDDEAYNPMKDLGDDTVEDVDDDEEEEEDSDEEDTDEDELDSDDELEEEEMEDEEEDEDDEEEEMEEEEEEMEESPVKSKKVMNGQAKLKKVEASPKSKDTPKKSKLEKQKESGKVQNKDKSEKKDQKHKKTDNKENVGTPKQDKKNKEGKTPKSEKSQKTPKQSRAGGVLVEDVTVGSGATAKNNSLVSMYYEGRLPNNKLFDKCLSGPPFKFRLGRGEVIKGWDVGVLGMQVGGKRRITIPPSMGYGKSGAPPAIPPNSRLDFEVTLIGCN